MIALARWAFALVLALAAAGLGYAVLQMPEAASALSAQAVAQLPNTGVQHPVTAVLLNYRGYDTLLEMVVLLLALLGAWGLSDSVKTPPLPAAGPVLDHLTGFLVPVLMVVAAYLLWVGAYSPGGAFQGGALLAGAGVLLSLVDPSWRERRFQGIADMSLLLGITVFIVVGVSSMLLRGSFLQYPVNAAGTLILLIESAAMLSIAVTLHTLFAGTARVGADR
jgi:multisubunit Na+/H+ antiporter MnhB subunit